MPEDVNPSQKGPRIGFSVRGPRDFWGGIVLIALAILAIWASRDLPGQRGFAFGPGTAPRLFSGLLAFIGAAVAAGGLFVEGRATSFSSSRSWDRPKCAGSKVSLRQP